ncbi:JAB domain-containing protein [Pontiellaceae bacterium B12227]|nr:JAB domain-containing protein [Pontiellaceae bacterium B12227]
MFEIHTQLAVRERSEQGPLIITPEQCAKYLSSIEDLAQEAFVIITLNTKNRAISKHLISLGTLNSALVHPREVFRVAIMDCANALLLAHNHPSGDVTPSAEDIKITRQLVSAGQIMGIKVLDHVILGSGSGSQTSNPFLSLREAGLVKFS